MLRLLGDTHGERKYLSPKHFLPDTIQLGDCHLHGYHFAHYDSPRYFIDGNHDNFRKINPNAINPYEIKGNLWYIPRGYVRDNILFIGGGNSIDKYLRREGYSWFPEESLTYKQMERIMSHNTKVDIIISHECPLNALQTMYSYVLDTTVSKDLNVVLEHYKPSLWVFGHHHEHFDFTLNNCRFIGLGKGEILEI